jgi:phenylacetate-CoA ligase
MSDYETIRQRHVADMMARLPAHVERLSWSSEQLRAERTARLRELLVVARERSPWQRARLAGIDVDAIDEDSLEELPVMTKADLMANFDSIVTDPRVTLALADAHLASLKSDAYLLDEFHVVASGGSSGVRGVFVWGWDAWADSWLVGLRQQLHDLMKMPGEGAKPPVIMLVAAEKATHFTASLAQTFASESVEVHRFPVTLPFGAIVDGLNRAGGNMLVAYASMLPMLAAAQRDGRLAIAPERIITTAEPLLPEIREAARAAWGDVPVINQWGTSEGGIVALGCGEGEGMHVCEDLLIIEAVDADGVPVAAGTPSAKIYLTNLCNPVLPLIRYEITDQVTFLDERCVCGSAYRRVADVQGRLDDTFTYPGGAVVHPHVFRSVLARDPSILEYQVRQTRDGAEVSLRAGGPLELGAIERAIAGELARMGCPAPVVSARVLDELPRVGIGKLKRFVPLEQAAQG